MALLNQKGFERKLQQMSSAQDSVQTVSLWIIHHKKYAGDIVKVWTENLKKCNPDRRLVLLYLANDVLQNSRKKGKEFSTAFSKVLKEVIPLLSERKISNSVQRVMKIWQERKVFDKDFLESLQKKFESCQSKSTKIPRKEPDTRVEQEAPKPEPDRQPHQQQHVQKEEKRLPPADYKPSQLIDALKAMRDFQAEVMLKESQLNSLRIDASDMEAIKQLKDRATGAKFTSEYEGASEKLGSFCETLKLEKEEILKLIHVLEDGKAFYDAAFGEVKVIVHAYKTFGNRLNSLKKKVDHKVAKIINEAADKKKMGPIHTPHSSFLTSGLPDISSGTPSSTPPYKTGGKNNETRSEEAGKFADPTVDNTEVADMDIEEDANSENGSSESLSDSTSTPSSDNKISETKLLAGNKPPVTIATVSSTSQISSTTSSLSSTSQAIPVQVHLPHQMMMQQPHMQFIPGQPGMPMIPVGMPRQFMTMPSQFHQTMIPYGMGMHGMSSFPGSIQTHMSGLMPGQVSMHTPNVGLVSNLPQQMQASAGLPMTLAPETMVSASNQSSASNVSLPGQSIQSSSMARQLSHSGTNVPTNPTESLGRPLPSSVLETHEDKHGNESMGSPSSERSAPSPVGSPELELGGDETPETASPEAIANVKIIGFPTISGQSDRAKESQQSTLPETSEGSTTSTGSGTPNHSSELSKPVSAVNILAQLISRGRKLKEQTSDVEIASEASTPKEEPINEVTQPQEGKPLFSLIDSLFPKLTDSLKTIRQREKDTETSTSTSEEGSPKEKIEINAMGDGDDSENESEIQNKGTSLEQPEQNPNHRGPFVGVYQSPGPRMPFGIQPPDGPVRQPWNNVPFPGHPGGPRPPFGREFLERPHMAPSSPLKGPGSSPRCPGPPRPFEVTQGSPFGPQVEYVNSEGMRAASERSPRQLHSPRAAFPSRLSPGGPAFPIDRGPLPEMHPDGPPNDGPPRESRSPRGSFIGQQHRGPQGPPERGGPHYEGISREEQPPHFRFDGLPGPLARPPGPPDMFGRPPVGSPRRSSVDGPPRWRGPDGPRGPAPPQEDVPRGFQRSHSDGGPREMAGEPPMKRPMLDEGHPETYHEQGRPGRLGFPHEDRPPISPGFDRNLWRERELWDPHHLGPRPDRGRPPHEFPEREECAPPRFIDHDNHPFPHERQGFPPPRRGSFKGFETSNFARRDHFNEHRRAQPRLPFSGAHQRPYF